jgi:hypothetical protein
MAAPRTTVVLDVRVPSRIERSSPSESQDAGHGGLLDYANRTLTSAGALIGP